ncbi:hypothetical protein FRC00_005418, partial [Tulasnella sp. 408]
MPPKLQDLPPELLDHIMYFLPASSVLHLMVNRKMRPVCEQYLYRTVELLALPYRSLHLLKAFALRLDLALLAQNLHINFEWCHPGQIASYKLPTLLQPDGLATLSLAKNIRSFGITGVNWLSDPTLAHILEVVRHMNLTYLLTEDWGGIRSDLETSRAVVSNLRAILQSQPQLESLAFSGYRIDAAIANTIEPADVPNLRQFQGRTTLAQAFLHAAPKLNDLNLALGTESRSNTPFPQIWDGHKIRALTTVVFLKYSSSWNSFGSFLESFPNVENLAILAMDWFDDDDLSSYFDSIASHLRTVPLLRKLEIRGVLQSLAKGLDPKPRDLLKFKECYPNLERFVDTEEREWVYTPSGEDGRGFDVRRECLL